MKKRFFSVLLCLCMVLGLLPTMAWADQCGGLTITGGTSGVDYTYEDNLLTIIRNGTYTISGDGNVDTSDMIYIDTPGSTVNITFGGVNLDGKSNENGFPVFSYGADTNVTVNLTLIGDNVLKAINDYAGLEVPSGSTLNITADSTGTLTAIGGSGGAGIGGDISCDCGTINILGGNVKAIAGSGAEAIGSGSSVDGGTLSGVGDVSLLRTPTVVTLEGITDAGVSVSDLNIKNGNGSTYAYGSTTTTLEGGELYLWLPEGATVTGATANDTHYCGSVAPGSTGELSPAVVSVAANSTTSYFGNFSAALTAAKDSDGSTLTLLKDVSYDSNVYLSKTMTLELNGHQLTFENGGSLTIESEGNLTVQDSVGEGVITSGVATLTANGVLTVNSGTIQTTATSNDALSCYEGSNVVIHGGTFIGTGKDVTFSGGNLMIDGGSFTNGGIWATEAGVTLKGGIFAKIEASSPLTANALLANGYCYYQGDDTTGSVVDGDTNFISETVTVGECDWSSAITYDNDTQTYTVLSAHGLDWISGVTNGTITEDTFQTDPQMPTKGSEGGYFDGATVKLNNDIDLSGKNWTPIKWFGGTFDGAGHSITNMTVDGAYDQSGFFASLAGEVRNLYIGGSVNVSSDSDIYAGGIVGFVSEYGSICNCTSGVTVTATSAPGQAVYKGGFVGSNDGNIRNCFFKEGNSGALIGRVGDYSVTENCYTPEGTAIVGIVEDSSTITSVGTYDESGNLTATNDSTLAYGTTLSNAMKYWVNRQVDMAVENEGEVYYVAWTTDAIPSLMTTYAQQGTHTFSEWTPQTDGGYIRTDLHTGITQIAEAVVTPSGGIAAPYATLEEAITAAKAVSGSTVKLITNVTTEGTVEVASGTFHIDLNGKTWESTVEDANALVLKGDSNVTLEDSGTDGTFTSTARGGNSTIHIAAASATIEGGSYCATGEYGHSLTILDIDREGKKVSISGGRFEGEAWIFDSNYVELSGGEFTSLEVQCNKEGVINMLDGFLADGYAYRSTLEGNAWVGNAHVGDLTNIFVKQAPVQITAQPQDVTVTYGYTTSPTLSVTTERLVPVGDITYQWFLAEATLATEKSATLSVPTGYAVGSYTYYCAVTCDGCTINSKPVTVKINKAAGSIVNKASQDGYPTTQIYTNTASPEDGSNFETNAESSLVFTWYAGQNTDGSVTNLTPLTPNTAPAKAGEYTLMVTFAESDNVTAASTTLKVTINKATPNLGTISYPGGTLYTSTLPSAVELIRDETSLGGTLALDGVTALTAGTNSYPWKFTPTDTDNYNTVTGTISLTVTADTLASISVGSTTPSKTAYQYGDTFDTNGLTVTATYLSGAQKVVTGLVTADALAVGDTSATLNYAEDGVTKSCTASGISVAKKQLNISGMSWKNEDNYIFNGSKQGITLEGTLPNGVTVSKSQDTGKNASYYKASATFELADGYSSANYEIVGANPLTALWSITEASAPNVVEQSKSQIRTIATTGNTALLAALLPENRGVTDYEVTSSSYSGLEKVSVSTDGTLSYDTKVSSSALTDTITVKVTMENYDATTITVKVNLTDKIDVMISGLSAPTNRVYNGMAVANIDFGIPTYSPLWNGTPTYTYYNGNSASGTPLGEAPKDGGTYTVRISIPDDDTACVGYTDITFTIGKATVIAVAENKIMIKGRVLPQFTVSYAGFASGDTAESIFATPAIAATTADGNTTGSYPITVTTPVLKSEMEKNYIVGTTVNGTLTVKKHSSNDSPSDFPGGSTGGSADVAITNNTNSAQISSGTGAFNASTSVSGNTATVFITDAQIKKIALGKDPVDTVKVNVSGLKVDTVVIPVKVISAAESVAGSTVGLEATLPSGTITLDKNAVKAIADKGEIKLSVETVENSALTEAQKAVLGTQANSATVVDVNVYVNGTKTSTFGDGKIEISVPYALKAGENADSITVWFIKDDGTIEPKNGVYRDGKVAFTTDHLSQYLIVNFPFADVNENEWYYGSVAYAYTNGLFSGTSAATFSPNTAMTREMIWMVLARMDGKAPANMAGACTWAVENKISDGSNPKGIITREQLAAILYRYSEYKGYPVTVGDHMLSYNDAATVSAYAISAVQWACNSELLKGDSNNLLPSGTATRAQVAAILMRFCKNVVK